MGLDMYLTAFRYVSPYSSKDKSDAIRALFADAPGTGVEDDGAVVGIDFRIGYWRKSNHIHLWIVKHCAADVDECQDIYMSAQHIADLLQTCRAVIASPEKGPELLPTGSGFFFGSTEYGEWYIEDIKETIEIFEKALLLVESGNYSINYRASW
jgi:hypothetical protein